MGSRLFDAPRCDSKSLVVVVTRPIPGNRHTAAVPTTSYVPFRCLSLVINACLLAGVVAFSSFLFILSLLKNFPSQLPRLPPSLPGYSALYSYRHPGTASTRNQAPSSLQPWPGSSQSHSHSSISIKSLRSPLLALLVPLPLHHFLPLDTMIRPIFPSDSSSP